MRITKQLYGLVLVGNLLCWPAAAQDRPFLFSVSTPQPEVSHVTVHLDAGVGEGPFDRDGYAVRASLTYGF